jgi:DNA-directed RNA polymerase II subunit RPB2
MHSSIIDSFDPASNALRGYNHFIRFGLDQMINQQAVMTTEFGHSYVVTNVRVEPPMLDDNTPMYPQHARMMKLNYEGNVYVDIQKIHSDTGSLLGSYERVLIFQLPIMVKSIACNLHKVIGTSPPVNYEDEFDRGGYFIINGNTRMLVIQERIAYNYVHAYKRDNETVSSIRSMSNDTGHSVYSEIIVRDDELLISLSFLKKTISIVHVLNVLGMNVEYKDWFISYLQSKYCDLSSNIIWLLRIAFNEVPLGDEHYDKSVAYIVSKISDKKHILDGISREDFVIQCIQNDLFPHLTLKASNEHLLHHVLYMVECCCAVHVGIIPETDRDHLQCKRYDDTGALIYYIVSSLYKKFITITRKRIKNNIDIRTVFQSNESISKNLRNCFATGNWGIQRGYTRTGVCQLYTNTSIIGAFSIMNRIMFPTKKDTKNKNIAIRRIHCSQYGFIDPVDTPEGQVVGIVKQLALFTMVSLDIPHVDMKNYIHLTLRDDATIQWFPMMRDNIMPTYIWMILVNGEFIASISNPHQIYIKLIQARDRDEIPSEVSIVYDTVMCQIIVNSDAGRLLRPLVVIYNYQQHLQSVHNMSMRDLIINRIIRWVDVHESTSQVIAPSMDDVSIYPEAMYAEIHPSFMLGVVSSIIPFLEHNQGPRNTYECSMVKQAIGIPSTNYRTKGDINCYTLWYSQTPIVSTHMDRIMNTATLGYGLNAIVAICTLTGFNQEDSLIINESAIDRGLYVASCYKTINALESRTGTQSEYIELPPTSIRNTSLDYSHLDEDGVIHEGACVGVNDVIIGKTLYNNGQPISDVSISLTIKDCAGGEAWVDKVMVADYKKFKTVQVVLRILKRPEIGDKWSSRFAQKGVCGMVYKQEDMPFTPEGIVPDIIINSLCIPSRMTIGQMLECVMGKAIVVSGDTTGHDATAFTRKGRDVIKLTSTTLKKYNYHCMGEEMLINGMTGERLRGTIFMGPTYYQRLKHLVSEKYHARSHGDVQGLTRQPVEGRSRDGGLRAGEMEKDALVAYGSTAFLRERTMTASDPFEVNVCNECKTMVSSNTGCNVCMHSQSRRTKIPYVFKLFMQEMQGLGVSIKLESDE